MIESLIFKMSETAISDSPLSKLSGEVVNKEMNLSKLDEPIAKDIKQPLNDELKKELKDYGMTDSLVEGARYSEKTNTIELNTINKDLENSIHPETGIPYERKEIQINDKKAEGVFPNFDDVSVYETKLSDANLKATDKHQFKECNQNLREEINSNKDLKQQFSEIQIEQIENGDTPRGYTWHHDIESGKMQLIPTDIHSKTGHTGGNALWGSGIRS